MDQPMQYDIYPCDLDPFGECPKKHQDCKHCIGYYYPIEEDEED